MGNVKVENEGGNVFGGLEADILDDGSSIKYTLGKRNGHFG